MAVAHSGKQTRPRGPAILQVVLALGVAVMLAAVTLTTRQSPPPAIAEFAPQAAEQIKEQPKEQASQFGSGTGPGDCPPGASCGAGPGAGNGTGAGGTGPGGGVAATTTTAKPPVKPPPTTKRCIGDPPRQIEDPQSPPCVAYWDDSKGNGGATSPGVTADTITVAVPGSINAQYTAWQTFFNNRFELYGRHVKLVPLSHGGGLAGADDALQAGAFAAMPSYADIPYYRELAHNKIIGLYRTPDFSDSELAGYQPYIWSYPMSLTQMEISLGDWACHRLAGQHAFHAGINDAQQMNTQTRKFALMIDQGTPDTTASTAVLKSALESCGASVPYRDSYPRFDEDAVRIRQEIVSMKAAGVTTVFCLCVSTNLVALQTHASTQNYQPEWVISNYPQLVEGDGYSGPEMDRTIGLSFAPMDRVPNDHPEVWAIREGDPANAQAIIASSNVGSDDIHYRAWLALMSGIQMAGPNLTPETFRAALQRTKFPNPDHPIMAGKVGFQWSSSMTLDAAELWLSTRSSDPNPYGSQNGTSFCWVDGGRRHARGTWPTGGDPFYTSAPCDTGNRSVS